MGGAKALWAPLKSTTADAFYHIMGNLFIKLNIIGQWQWHYDSGYITVGIPQASIPTISCYISIYWVLFLVACT